MRFYILLVYLLLAVNITANELNIFSARQEVLMKPLIKKFESLKYTVVPVQMRHIYTQGGGIHCATLDTVRDSKLESYF